MFSYVKNVHGYQGGYAPPLIVVGLLCEIKSPNHENGDKIIYLIE